MDTKLTITLAVDIAVIMAVLALAVQWGRMNEEIEHLSNAVVRLQSAHLDDIQNNSRLVRMETKLEAISDDVSEIKTELKAHDVSDR